MELSLDTVESCHHQGGSILASSRGGFDLEVIVSFLLDNDIDQLYVIGGDGTHRGANIIAQVRFTFSVCVCVCACVCVCVWICGYVDMYALH